MLPEERVTNRARPDEVWKRQPPLIYAYFASLTDNCCTVHNLLICSLSLSLVIITTVLLRYWHDFLSPPQHLSDSDCRHPVQTSAKATTTSAASDESATCAICHKTFDMSQFSKKQRTRMRKGMPGKCQRCTATSAAATTKKKSKNGPKPTSSQPKKTGEVRQL